MIYTYRTLVIRAEEQGDCIKRLVAVLQPVLKHYAGVIQTLIRVYPITSLNTSTTNPATMTWCLSTYQKLMACVETDSQITNRHNRHDVLARK